MVSRVELDQRSEMEIDARFTPRKPLNSEFWSARLCVSFKLRTYEQIKKRGSFFFRLCSQVINH